MMVLVVGSLGREVRVVATVREGLETVAAAEMVKEGGEAVGR